MSRYKILGHRLEISGRRLEISGRRLEFSGRQKQSSPGGSDGKCWAESERKSHENMLATCSLMYIQLIYIAYHIKACFW